MDLITVVNLIQAVDNLRANLLGQTNLVRRVKRGSLSVAGRGDVVRHIVAFRRTLVPYQQIIDQDPIVSQVLVTIYSEGSTLTTLPANDHGGYVLIERNYGTILNQLGFIKGYLFSAYKHLRPDVKKPEASEDDSEDFDEEDEDDDYDDQDEDPQERQFLLPEFTGLTI